MRKVIRASAGTGKTYRLSLEFIALLLTNEQLRFEEILVITFTKKATAEIRERIMEHLQELISNPKSDLWKNLATLNPKIRNTNDFINKIHKLQKEITLKKHKLQISTIDSFTNSLFSNFTAPSLHISTYEIDPNCNEQYMEELFEVVFQPQNLPKVKVLITEKTAKNVKRYEDFIKAIIQKRWLFETEFETLSDEEISKLKESNFAIYQQEMQTVLENFFTYFEQYCERKKFAGDWQALFKKDFVNFAGNALFTSNSTSEVRHQFSQFFSSRNKILEDYHIFISDDTLWNGNKLFRQKCDTELKESILEQLRIAKEFLSEYLFWEKVIPEQQAIYELAKLILEKYDSLKLRDKIFTYDDISFYTYRLLYDDTISIVDEKQVLNMFYERLSSKIRYILIDEFQDTSLLQWKIVSPVIQELISGSGQKEFGGVCLVGDEKQSIYGWRGGKPELLINAAEFLATDDVESLSISYRSKENIIEFVNLFFGNDFLHNSLMNNNLQWKYSALEKRESGGYVGMQTFNRKIEVEEDLSSQEQIENIVKDKIKPLFEKGILKPSKTAILARKNVQLENFAAAFRDENINYSLESSLSIFQQRAIRPLFFLYKFIAYHDLVELVKWFRSDVMLLPSEQLKELMLQISSNKEDIAAFLSSHSNEKMWDNLYRLQLLSNQNQVRELLVSSLELFNITSIYTTETDLKNIHRLLEIGGDFANTQTEFAYNLAGFIEYCQALEEKEEYKQLSHVDENAVQLLSFHKSKGLQFDNVFVFLDISSRSQTDKLYFYEQWDKQFYALEEKLITYNHNEIIKKSTKKYILENEQKQKDFEELNNLYVALTRAKKNLWLLVSYKNKDDFPKYVANDKQKNVSISQQIFSAFCQEKPLETSNEYEYQIGTIEPDKMSENTLTPSIISTDFLELNDTRVLIEKDEKIDYEKIDANLLSRKRLHGIIAHHFLSYIDFDTPEKRLTAYYKTKSKFGALTQDIDMIISSAHKFLDKNGYYFSSQNWEIVKTEYPVRGKKSYRIDRLLLNSKEKKIVIIDFKIGEIYQQSQIEDYKNAIRELPFVKSNQFEVTGLFLEVPLSNDIAE
jgi:ATP-dependent exoDNAse (exonuclease V) beta subunit